MTEYLPGSTGERITELREGAGLTIEELAAKIGVNATTLGRMENGRTQKIGDDVLAALAREFNVSTDFLLGLTSIPDRKNYDIAELGLSAQAARNLYTRKVNADVVNRLLEHPRFAVLTAMIAQYLDDAFAAGVAILRELKQTTGSNLEPAKAATKEIIDKMMSELTKGQDALSPSATPEQITDAIIHTVDGSKLDPEKLAEFRGGLVSLFENLPRINDTNDQ